MFLIFIKCMGTLRCRWPHDLRVPILLICVLLGHLTATPAAPPTRETVAVLDLSGTFTAGELTTLTNRLLAELMSTGLFTVVERSEMENILKEQGFQQTGCISSECAVEVGQLLGVQKMVAGDIGKVGTLFSISLRILDVATGEIVKNVNVNARGTIEDVLLGGLAQAVQALTGVRTSAATGLAGTGDLVISSTPSGADIYIDGTRQEQKTPATLHTIAAGRREILIRNNDLVATTTVDLKNNDLMKVDLELVKGRGRLVVMSTPGGATVLVNGESKGTTPAVLSDLIPGDIQLRVELDGHVPIEERVELSVSEAIRKNYALDKAAYLTLALKPSDMSVSHNGIALATADAHKIAVVPGRARLTFSRDNYLPRTIDTNLLVSESYPLEVTLTPRFAVLNVEAHRVGREVPLTDPAPHPCPGPLPLEIAISIRPVSGPAIEGRTPFHADTLLPGEYHIVFADSRYDTLTTTIMLRQGEEQHLCASLRYRATFLADSLGQVGVTQLTRLKKAGAVLALAGALAGGGAAGYMNYRASHHYNDYENAVIQSHMNDAWERYERAYGQMLAAAVTGGIMLPVSVFLYVKKVRMVPVQVSYAPGQRGGTALVEVVYGF